LRRDQCNKKCGSRAPVRSSWIADPEGHEVPRRKRGRRTFVTCGPATSTLESSRGE
jgi:hypothetical protein